MIGSKGLWSEIRDALDDAVAEFPAGVQSPEFSADGAGTYGAMVALTAEHDQVLPTIIGRYAEDLAEDLRNIPGSRKVTVYGAPEEEVLVALDPGRTAALGLTAEAVSTAIAAADSKGQAGRLRGSGNDLIVDVVGDIETLARLR